MIVSNAKSWTKRPCLLTKCKGRYHCTNSKCLNLEDFGINQVDFETSLKSKETVRCKVCKSAVIPIPCNDHLFVEQDLDKKTDFVKNWGIHTCPTKKMG